MDVSKEAFIPASFSTSSYFVAVSVSKSEVDVPITAEFVTESVIVFAAANELGIITSESDNAIAIPDFINFLIILLPS
jgi:hypothetical protein